MKIIVFTIILLFCLSSCEDRTELTNKPVKANGVIVNKTNISADTSTTIYKYLHQLGAIKWECIHKTDWCGLNSKIYKLYDSNGFAILSLGIENGCLIAYRSEFNKAGHLSNQNDLFVKGENCFANGDSLCKNDSLLLKTIIPIVKAKIATRKGC